MPGLKTYAFSLKKGALIFSWWPTDTKDGVKEFQTYSPKVKVGHLTTATYDIPVAT